MKLPEDVERSMRGWLAAERDRTNREHFGEYLRDHPFVANVLGVVGLIVIVLFFVVLIP